MKSIIALLMLLATGTTLADTTSLTGTFLYKYDGGATYRVDIPNAETLKWECIEGPEKGAKGEETPTRFTVENGVYFVTWVEETGSIVTQVVNLKRRKVYSTIVEGEDRYVLEGDIVITEDEPNK